MFQIIGAMAEFERALIQERVRAGLRNAKAKGKQIGRPRQAVDSAKALELRCPRSFLARCFESLKARIGHCMRGCYGVQKARADSTLVDYRTTAAGLTLGRIVRYPTARHLHCVPYLDYRPLGAGEPEAGAILAQRTPSPCRIFVSRI